MSRWGAVVEALRHDDLLVGTPPPADVAVTGLTTDSRDVVPGSLYIALRGSVTDGHRFVADAVARGAAAVMVEEDSSVGVPAIVVRDGRRAARVAARVWFDNPTTGLVLWGVTGTNGKTTTTALLRHLCNGNGSAGSIGTLGAFDGQGRPVPSTAGNLTTPGPVDLVATMAGLRAAGVTDVAMEASSHSLHQGRLDGLAFAAAVFTNLTRDHLDYHGTMEAYRAAKLELLALLQPDGVAVLNADDPAWDGIPGSISRVTYGFGPGADVRAEGLELSATGAAFRLRGRYGEAAVQLPLLGEFNVANALAAASAVLGRGRPLDDVASRLREAPQVPGRMERLTDVPCVVLRDYAHTPDALARALTALRPLTTGRLIAVFGCGGDRDRGKRPMMGRIAQTLADVPVLTSDNPRTEDPDAILDDVEAGLGPGRRLRFADRREAIAAALAEARPGDVLLLAGKGHETYQVIGTEKRPFDERAIVADLTGRPS